LTDLVQYIDNSVGTNFLHVGLCNTQIKTKLT